MLNLRQGTLAMLGSLALVAAASAANAQTTVITTELAPTQTVVTTPLQLTPVQRQTVYRTIVRERVEPAAPVVEYRVGNPIPRTAHLYTVPDSLAVEVPAIRSYKYMVVNNRVVLVDPATSQVVAELAN